MDILSFLGEKFIILVPTIYIVGMILKASALKDKFINVTLLLISVVFSFALGGINVDSAIQAILATGLATYGNQVLKQLKKND